MMMTSDQRPQNIYDDARFFAGYARLERFGEGWTGAYEHTAFKALLPDLTGRRALDLGCGTGQWTAYLAECGAAEVVGVDLSERMLAVARRDRAHPRVTYQRASMEEAAFPPECFEVVISSLAFHYVEDFAALARRIASWLTPGGHLVFSNEHPVYLSRATPEGWVRDAAGTVTHWALSRYGEEGLREESWIMDGVRKYHRMVSTILNDLTDAGLIVERVEEPMPDAEMLLRRPDWIVERGRPFCLLVRARKP
ncbi:MAG: methyltransferase domain-containing protein [Chloroflexi bacterium]|nr:methyltransferase domain-containing protein [Chloroflexota bacterium]